MTVRSQLRPWQQEALTRWEACNDRDFLAVATPGAGKTTFALQAAARAFQREEVDQLVVVCPSDHLRRQWADAAEAIGLPVDPDFTNRDGVTSPQFCGVAVTYAQVANAPLVHQRAVATARTFVIFDEVHHAGQDLSWGDGLRQAYEPANFRLALSGTPWRSDANPIPFVTYAPDGHGQMVSVPDYRYGYGQALTDGVVRPVVFMAYSGQARWQDSAGAELEARLDDPVTSSVMRQAWRTALDPSGSWISSVLRAADARLQAVRDAGMPDAGGLVIASNRAHARAYAKQLEEVCGQPVCVVTSDDPTASDRIEAFASSRQRWMVAVRMVSEGVDVPRLAVGVYATNVSAPLFFAQAVGRFVRARRPGESATVFLPSVRPLLELAAGLEAERNHVLGEQGEAGLDDAALVAANRVLDEKLAAGRFQALEASGHLDRVIYDGAEHGTLATVGSTAESAWLTLPGMLDVRDLAGAVRSRAALARESDGSSWGGGVQVPLHRQVSAARRELHKLVGALHHRTKAPHGEIHARLRQLCGGPQAAAATLDQLEARIAMARSML